MDYVVTSSLLAIALFACMILTIEVGRRVGLVLVAKSPDGKLPSAGAIEGAVFGLLGLLIAFTFASAASRFDDRRQLIVTEVNAIGTAYLRAELLSPEARDDLRRSFREYIETRMSVYRKLSNAEAAKQEYARSIEIQDRLWRQAVALVRAEGYQPATMLLLPAINEMIDISTTRSAALEMHPPRVIYVMLFGMALASSLLAGYGMAAGKTRGWLHILGFASSLALVVFIILDIEFPRLGLIRVDDFDHFFRELRAQMK